MRRKSLFSRRPQEYEDPYASGRPDATLDTLSAPPSPSLLDTRNAPFLKLVCLFGVFAVMILFISFRLSVRGRWLPEVPLQIANIWEATDVPLPPSALALIGFPPTRGYRYANLFSERVETHIIATSSFDSYRDPPITLSGYGYSLTGEKKIPLFGPNKNVRAIILHNDTNNDRIMMYYWIQYKSGETLTGNNLRDYRDVFPRFSLGLSSVLRGEENVIVRVYTQIHPQDKYGHQARRNMSQICRALYASIDRQAHGGPVEEPPTAPKKTASVTKGATL